MKIKTIAIISVLSCLLLSFTACNSTKVETEDPYFLADMDAFSIGNVVGLNKQNFFNPKPIDIQVDFFPRTSSVALYFKDGMNKVYLIFSPEEFKNLQDSVAKYMEIKDGTGFDKNYKPGRKNRFHKGYVNILWGAVGLGREVEAPFDTNYQWLEVNGESNPYFRIEVTSTAYPEEEHVNSPTVSLYLVPSQAQALADIVNTESIMKEISDFNSAAYDFE